jgi:hypothetical protein
MLRSAVALGLLAAPTPAAAQLAPGLCHDLRMVVASTTQREPFARVTYHENWRRFRLFEQCRPNRVGPVDRAACSWRLASAQPIVDALAAEAARCLPRARRDDAGGPGGRQFHAARFVLGRLTIYVEQDVAAPDTLGNGAAVLIVIDEQG